MANSAWDIFSNLEFIIPAILFLTLLSVEFLWLPSDKHQNHHLVRLKDFHEISFEKLEPLLRKFSISKIYLVHGTFAGIDPLGFKEIPLLSALSFWLGRCLRFFIRGRGYFHPKLIDQLQRHIQTELIDWGGENHHLGRLKGAFQLLQQLSPSEGGQIIIGHSHAAQLLAMTQHMRKQTELGKSLFGYAAQLGFNQDKLREQIKVTESQAIYWITLGSKLRLTFPTSDLDYLAHFHNCRTTQRTRLIGILTARPGDMIQSWAVEGSDFLPTTSPDFKLCLELEKLLDRGVSPLKWAQQMARGGTRLNAEGTNFALSYKDSNLPLIGPFLSIWGHGVYLSKKAIFYQIYSYLHWLDSNFKDQSDSASQSESKIPQKSAQM